MLYNSFMKKTILSFLITFSITLTIQNAVSADQVTLKSGQTIEGVLIEYRNGTLHMDTGEDVVEILPTDIETIVTFQPGKDGELMELRLSGKYLESFITGGDLSKIILSADAEEKHFTLYVAALYTQERFAELEKILTELRTDQPRMRSGKFKIRAFYEGVVGGFGSVGSTNYSSFVKIAEKWKTAYPDSVAPFCFIAQANTDKAWYHRGGGWASSVSPEKLKLFKEYTDKSARILEEGEKAKDKDEYFYYLRMLSNRVVNISESKSMLYLRKALAINPLFYDAYREIARQTLPRWGGYPGQIEEFADFAYKNSPTGTEAFHYAVVANEARNKDADSFAEKYHFDWEKIKKGLLLVHEKSPASLYWLNTLASFACIYKDRDAAQRAFYFIGERWDPKSETIWSKTECDQCRAWSTSGAEESTPIFKAVRTKDYQLLQKLHDEGANLNVQNSSGQTPLMIAIADNNDFFAKKLIRFGADVNITDKDGETALHYAANVVLPEVAEMLIEAGANINAPSEKNGKKTPLHYAAYRGGIGAVNVLLNNPKTDINAKDEMERMPLHLAAKSGQLNIVKAIIDKDRTNLDFMDSFGWTPLTYAARNGFIDVVEFLVQNGANLNHKTKDGETALNLAMESGNEKMIVKLKELGAIAADVDELKASHERLKKETMLGMIYMKNKEYDKALEQFDICIELLPTEPSGYFNKFQIVSNIHKNYSQALELINKAIELDPNNVLYHFQRGVTYVQINDKKKARENFLKCIELAPDSQESKVIHSNFSEYIE